MYKAHFPHITRGFSVFPILPRGHDILGVSASVFDVGREGGRCTRRESHRFAPRPPAFVATPSAENAGSGATGCGERLE